MTRLVLASASPRRRMLLAAVGRAPSVVVAADIDERPVADESPVRLVRRLARAKRDTVASDLADDEVVLAADTVVALRGRVLGKPADDDEARAMLRSLSGCVAVVWSGVAVSGGVPAADVVVGTLLRFHPSSDGTIDDYVASGEPVGAAGGFRIQGRGAALVAAATGCPTNVVGLPLCETVPLVTGRPRAAAPTVDCDTVVAGLRAPDLA